VAELIFCEFEGELVLLADPFSVILADEGAILGLVGSAADASEAGEHLDVVDVLLGGFDGAEVGDHCVWGGCDFQVAEDLLGDFGCCGGGIG
jgi:hypothetical protein